MAFFPFLAGGVNQGYDEVTVRRGYAIHLPMMMPILRRSVPALARGFSSAGVKRAKPIRVKKSEARRLVPDAPKPSDALTEAPAPPPLANPFVQSEQQAPQTFGGVMKESFLWGVGMAVAFSVVGIVVSSMEETTAPGQFEGSVVVEAGQREQD